MACLSVLINGVTVIVVRIPVGDGTPAERSDTAFHRGVPRFFDSTVIADHWVTVFVAVVFAETVVAVISVNKCREVLNSSVLRVYRVRIDLSLR